MKCAHQRDKSRSGEATGKFPAFFHSAGSFMSSPTKVEVTAQPVSPAKAAPERMRTQTKFIAGNRSNPHACDPLVNLKHSEKNRAGRGPSEGAPAMPNRPWLLVGPGRWGRIRVGQR